MTNNDNQANKENAFNTLNEKNRNLPLRSRMAKMENEDEYTIHREIVLKKAEKNRGMVRKRKYQEKKK